MSGWTPRAAIANDPDLMRRELGIPEDRMVVCGMALGRADPAAPVNGRRVERAPASTFDRPRYLKAAAKTVGPARQGPVLLVDGWLVDLLGHGLRLGS